MTAEAPSAAGAVAEHRAALDAVETLLPAVGDLAARLVDCFTAGGRVLSFGNGGSACDAQHLTEELVARYRRERRALPATCLSSDPSVLTCVGNDFGFAELFARQVQAHARPGDIVCAFTTSGRSENIVRGLAAAREAGATAALFGGGDGGDALAHADHALVIPSRATARVQEMHVLLVHLLIEPVDAWAAGEEAAA
ncbi:MAG TPA: SIS domain-containing protein [Solirubrobacteraceae bacterium]|nr:SIS domain-containing protein [Solirubrobacteraceae bacterium]